MEAIDPTGVGSYERRDTNHVNPEMRQRLAKLQLPIMFSAPYSYQTAAIETAFAALLFCLARLGALKLADGPALVTRVFARYLELARALQRTYCLEPAGSHGVWGLDDYQFLAFLFGAAQLAGHPFIRPRSIHSADVVETYGGEYLYLGCVRHVLSVKKGAITTTSPMLNDVSGVRGGWEKVASGLVKMYKGEVLAKLPIMQHFLFGSLLPFPAPPGPPPGLPPAFSA